LFAFVCVCLRLFAFVCVCLCLFALCYFAFGCASDTPKINVNALAICTAQIISDK
jgi:hypothetical protein